MRNDLSPQDVSYLEHKLINNSMLFDCVDEADLSKAMLAYVSGVNDFAEEIIKFLNQGEDK
ncbi:MAG: hypothetical protein MSH58_12800 [Clostridiales bacterium]|nr:hypothetical protein [Clostridiales bacterium]